VFARYVFKFMVSTISQKAAENTWLPIKLLLMLIGTAMDPFHWRRNGPTPFVP
tara:strand:+ start:255 stop:413 length:159 start_codon:yes stop_codon:yes gene_type:complete